MKRQFESWMATGALLLACACSDNGGQVATAGSASMTPTAGKPPTAAGTAAVAGTNAVAGTTAPAAGTGVGGSPAAVGDDMKCGTTSAMPGPMLHAAALAALVPTGTAQSPCAFSSCHNANQMKAGLNLDASITDLKATLVNKPSCQVPTMPLVDGSGGDAALAKSWLWWKCVTAEYDGSSAIVGKPEWGTGAPGCSQDPGQPFGVRMPKSSPDGLPESRRPAVKAWICAGAPGPT